MSFHPLALPVAVSGDLFTFKDITLPYPESPIGWGAPNAPTDPSAITAIWGEVEPFGQAPIPSTVTKGSLTAEVALSVSIEEGVNLVHLYYGEFIPFPFTVSEDRLTIYFDPSLNNHMDAVKAISIGAVFPAKTDVLSEGVLTLLSPLDKAITEGTHLYRYFEAQVHLTPQTKATVHTFVANRVPPVAEKLAIGAKITGNGFNLKWTVLAAELTNAPRFVAIGSSTFAGVGASNAAQSVGGLLAAQLNNYAGILCNNAFTMLDTRNGLPNGTGTLVRENRNISMAMAANPTAIIIAYPTNDIGNGLTPAQFRDNIQLMYSLARQRSIPTFVISPQPRTGYNVAQQNDLLTAATLIKDIIPIEFYVDVMEPLRDPNSTKPADINPAYNADNIHPNDAGHAIIYNLLWDRISNYFVNPVYSGYTIESATVTGNGEVSATWTTFDTITDENIVSKTYPRGDADWHAYRVTAADPATTPSDPIWVYQPISSTSVAQTVQVDLSLDTIPAPPADWNNFTATSSGPVLNQTLALNDVTGVTSGITATVTKVFPAAGNGGANVGIYPKTVMQDFWTLSSSTTTSAQVRLTGLLPGNVYNIEFTSSRDTPEINRVICLTVNDGTAVDKRDAMSCVTAANAPNQFGIRTLEGVVPTATGIITIDIHCAGNTAHLNAVVLRKMNN
jgi:lysophospholipase L1-like esterase